MQTVIRCSLLWVLLLLAGTTCYALDLQQLGKTLESLDLAEPLEEITGIPLAAVQDYLQWDRHALSLEADMTNHLDMLGRQAQVSAKISKLGLQKLRIDLQSGLTVPFEQTTITLPDVYILRYPLKKKAYLVVPQKKTYMKLDPEKSQELIGQMRERLDDPSVTFEQRELLGQETVDGHACDVLRLVARFSNKTTSDITAWLARDLEHFPVKISTTYQTVQGLSGKNLTRFRNIRKTVPAESLFVIPDEFRRCTTFGELVSGKPFGAGLKKGPKPR